MQKVILYILHYTIIKIVFCRLRYHLRSGLQLFVKTTLQKNSIQLSKKEFHRLQFKTFGFTTYVLIYAVTLSAALFENSTSLLNFQLFG